ncbi:RICIN domain-containing protein [Actinoplanes bogorensis]|uniref:RICIN domain-containing protein n=1 Tax=Paractinoplanes bogorensis TaxID=1610840 RepID=A0ABS5Z3F5_9ACTN|nr:RICIN domain-containing protein [Actinoplanes bogorensis]MBU2670229.1 RICIN domain-containing protein [Actinoplanes bogorensis]
MTDRRQAMRSLTAAAAAVVLLLLSFGVAAPAQAAGRMFKHNNGLCVRDTIEIINIKPCEAAPVTARNWSFVGRGTLNGHALYMFKNVQTSACMASVGDTFGPLGFRCLNADDAEIWEVFTVGSGTSQRQVLKSYGAFKLGKHMCLEYTPPYTVMANLGLSPCNLNSTNQKFRLF